MKFIFDEDGIGESPIDYFHLCWYDTENNNRCFDEDFISKDKFGTHVIEQLDCDKNENDSDRTRLFGWTKDKEVYELRLHKLTPEQWDKAWEFYSGRDK